ncbi:MAG: RHS domain-containing protein, partial [Bacteroidales bacterium]|nr:RHS domain-containing protein [Bacteroidales bacterium]
MKTVLMFLSCRAVCRAAYPRIEGVSSDNGNITEKTDVGRYSYDAPNPYAVTGVTNVSDLINTRGQTIRYNVFRKAYNLQDTLKGDACELDILYGPEQQRWKSVLTRNGRFAQTAFFAGDYEKIVRRSSTRQFYYLPGGAIYVKEDGQEDKVYYAHKDHLGSILKLTDAEGTEVFAAEYDAWGQRKVTNQTFYFHRGYTGHEHLPDFGLINMNGRMYNPLLGRFLSAAPFVQTPDFSQSFNRYSYCLNNPLLYTDPSGYKWWSWLLALIDPVSAITTVTVAGGTALVTGSALVTGTYAVASTTANVTA